MALIKKLRKAVIFSEPNGLSSSHFLEYGVIGLLFSIYARAFGWKCFNKIIFLPR
jgi:hypothetical protein